MGWARSCSQQVLRCCGGLRELLPRSDLPGAQQKTPFNVNRYVLLLMYVVGVACTGPLFFNWSPLAELLFRNEAFAELCEKDPVSGAYTPDLRRRRPRKQPPDDGRDPGDEEGGHPYICDRQEAAVQQLYTVCCAVCCCFCAVAGSLMDFMGPRVTMVIGRLFQTLGWLLLAFAGVSSKLYYAGIAFFAAGVDAVVLPTLSVCRLFPASEGLIITVVGSALSASYAVPLVMKHFAEAYGQSFRVICLSYALLCPFALAIFAFFFVPKKNFGHFPVEEQEAGAAGGNDHAGGGGVEKGATSDVEAMAATDSGETRELGAGNERIKEHHTTQTIERGGGGGEDGGKRDRMEARDNNRDVEGRGEQEKGKRTEEGGDQEEEEDDDEETKFGSKRKTGDTNGDVWRRGSSSVSTTRGDRGVSRSFSGWQGDAASLEVECVEQIDDRRLVSHPGSKVEENSGHCKSRLENSSRTRGERGSARGSSRRGSNSSYSSSGAEKRLQIRTCSCEEARYENRSSRGVASHWIRKNEDDVSQRVDGVASPVVVVEEAGNSRNMHCCSASDATTRDRCRYTGACESSTGRQGDTETGTASAAAGAAAPAPARPAHVSQAMCTAVAGRTIRSAAAAAASHTVEEVALPAPTAIQSAAASQSSSSTTTDAVFLTDTATKNNSPPATVHLHHSAEPAPLLSENSRGGGAGLTAASGAAFSAASASSFVDGGGSGGAACSAYAGGGAGLAADDATAVLAARVANAADTRAVEGGGRPQFRVEGVFAADAPCESEEDSKALLTTDSKGKSSSSGNNSNQTNRAGAVAHYEETGAAPGAAREGSTLSAASGKRPEMIAISVGSPTARNSCSSSVVGVADITSSARNSNREEGRSGTGASHRWTSTGCSSRRAGNCSNGGEKEAAATSASGATPTRMLEEPPAFDASPEAGHSSSTVSCVSSPTAIPPPAAATAESAEAETSSPVAAGGSEALSRPAQLGSRSKRFPSAGLLLSRRGDNPSLLLPLGVGSQQLAAAAAAEGGPPSAGTGAAETPPTSSGGGERSESAARAPVCTSDDSSGEGGVTEGRNRSKSCCSSAALLDLPKRGWRDWWVRYSQWTRSRSAVRQFLSERYMLILLYKIMVVLVATYYQEASQRMFNARVLRVRALLLPFSFLPCIALGKAADCFGIVYVLFVVNFFGFSTYFFSFFSQYSIAWAYVSSCFFVCYMSFYSSQIFIYVETTFSPEHFGKLSGFSLLVGGVTSLATHPLYSHLTVAHHGGNTLAVRIALTVPIVLLNLLLVRLLLLYRQNPQPYRTAVCIDEERGGDTREPATAEPEHPPQSGEEGCFCRKSSSISKLHEFAATGATALSNNDESPAAAPIAV